MTDKLFYVSFQCYYPDGGVSKHMQVLPMKDIPRWADSYKFTHPNCESITCKIWFSDLNRQDELK